MYLFIFPHHADDEVNDGVKGGMGTGRAGWRGETMNFLLHYYIYYFFLLSRLGGACLVFRFGQTGKRWDRCYLCIFLSYVSVTLAGGGNFCEYSSSCSNFSQTMYYITVHCPHSRAFRSVVP